MCPFSPQVFCSSEGSKSDPISKNASPELRSKLLLAKARAEAKQAEAAAKIAEIEYLELQMLAATSFAASETLSQKPADDKDKIPAVDSKDVDEPIPTSS